MFDLFFKGFNMMMYFMIIVYMLFAVTIAVMYDSYRSITIMKGDPLEKVKKEEKQRTKTTAQKVRAKFIKFVQWFLEFTDICKPNCVEKITEYLEKEEEVVSDEEEAKEKQKVKENASKKKKKGKKKVN